MPAQQMKKLLRKIRVSHKVTPCTVERKQKNYSLRNYYLSDSQKMAKMIASEINGLAPYEKKAIEYIKSDNIKKARKFLKIRLGSLSRAEKKFDLLMKQYR